MADEISDQYLAEHVLVSLVEDLGEGDVTTEALAGAEKAVRGRIVARETGTLAGSSLVDMTYHTLADALYQRDTVPEVKWDHGDGDRVETGQEVARVQGPADLLLTGERVALNYLQQLSGIATETRRYVEVAGDWDVKVYDTRKTVPHMRRLHKYAVRCGGGRNHRMTLSDAVMIKDNHKVQAGGLRSALKRIDDALPVVVEIHDATELSELGDFDIDVIMLDNFDSESAGELVGNAPADAEVEVSGGITLDNLEAYCQSGIDRVSVGALTHSYDSLDFSFELIQDG